MNKFLLPMVAGALLMSQPSFAQSIEYSDPFDRFFDTMLFNPKRIDDRIVSGPRMDVADMGDKIEIKAELPGMDEKDVKLTYADDVLTLSGERQQTVEENSKGYYLKEISSGSFSRSIRLPKNLDISKIDAVFKKGVLTIVIPKVEAKNDNVKTIPIKGGD